MCTASLRFQLLLEGRHRPEHRPTLEQYRSKAEHYLCACLGKNGAAGNVNRTAGGMLFVRQWNNLQYVTNAAFLLTAYSRYLSAGAASPGLLRCPRGAAAPAELLALAPDPPETKKRGEGKEERGGGLPVKRQTRRSSPPVRRRALAPCLPPLSPRTPGRRSAGFVHGPLRSGSILAWNRLE